MRSGVADEWIARRTNLSVLRNPHRLSSLTLSSFLEYNIQSSKENQKEKEAGCYHQTGGLITVEITIYKLHKCIESTENIDMKCLIKSYTLAHIYGIEGE